MFSQNGHRHYKNFTANATRCFQCMLDPLWILDVIGLKIFKD